MRLLGAKIWEAKRVELGEGHVMQYTLFEHKRLFSILFYRWRTIDQMRFHTHAFGAVAFLLWGWYWEKVMFGDTIMTNFVNVPLIPRLLPRNYCHAVGHALPGTLTMVVTGPWQKTWQEYFPGRLRSHHEPAEPGTWVTYAWGRRKIGFSEQRTS